MRSLTAVIAAALTVLAVSTSAPADPIVRHRTCDHAGIESTVLKRHVNYLATQGTCDFAQHVARIWVHDHACGLSACNIWQGSTAIAYCTTVKEASGEYFTKCSGHYVLIGWKRPA